MPQLPTTVRHAITAITIIHQILVWSAIWMIIIIPTTLITVRRNSQQIVRVAILKMPGNLPLLIMTDSISQSIAGSIERRGINVWNVIPYQEIFQFLVALIAMNIVIRPHLMTSTKNFRIIPIQV